MTSFIVGDCLLRCTGCYLLCHRPCIVSFRIFVFIIFHALRPHQHLVVFAMFIAAKSLFCTGHPWWRVPKPPFRCISCADVAASGLRLCYRSRVPAIHSDVGNTVEARLTRLLENNVCISPFLSLFAGPLHRLLLGLSGILPHCQSPLCVDPE